MLFSVICSLSSQLNYLSILRTKKKRKEKKKKKETPKPKPNAAFKSPCALNSIWGVSQGLLNETQQHFHYFILGLQPKFYRME